MGAGDGVLTFLLAGTGARVVAVELHPERCRLLREVHADGDVIVVQADARDLRLPRRPFHVVANPPFGATAGLLRRLVAPGSRLVEARLVVPRHVARRWTSGEAPGAARWAAQFEASTGRAIPRSAFRPPPPHDAVVLVVSRRAGSAAAAGRARRLQSGRGAAAT